MRKEIGPVMIIQVIWKGRLLDWKKYFNKNLQKWWL